MLRLVKKFSETASTSCHQDANEPIFVSNKNFPSTDAVIPKQNETFENHLVAANDIKIGDLVLVSAPYANVEYVSCIDNTKCFNCGQAKEKKIECKYCIDVWFCSKNCSFNTVHKDICNESYSKTDCMLIRLVTETITIAAKDNHTFLNFCGDAEKDQSQYGFISNLKGYTQECTRSIARRAALLVKRLPQFESINCSTERMIYHSAFHLAASIPLNAFSDRRVVSKGGALHQYAIHSILSWFNHSCSPNINHYIDDDGLTYCEATQPVPKGKQLFINYFGNQEFNSEERRQILQKIWKFDCKCSKCVKETDKRTG